MKAKSVTIGSIAEVLPGFSPRRAVVHNPMGTHQVISARHLEEGAPYRYQPADALRVTPDRDVARYLVRSGEVLFISRGTRNIAVEIGAVPEFSITTGTFYVLRMNTENIFPGYLAWGINQPPFQGQLDEIRTGAGTPMIPRNAFSQLSIPIPPRDTQRTIMNLARLQSRERDLRLRLQAETEALHRTMGTTIFRQLMQPGAKE